MKHLRDTWLRLIVVISITTLGIAAENAPDYKAYKMKSSCTDKTSHIPVNQVTPQYPRKTPHLNIEGFVEVEVTVNPDGSVDRDTIIILDSQPKGYFERSAIRAAAQLQYQPCHKGGVAQKVTGVKYRFSFDLGESILNSN